MMPVMVTRREGIEIYIGHWDEIMVDGDTVTLTCYHGIEIESRVIRDVVRLRVM